MLRLIWRLSTSPQVIKLKNISKILFYFSGENKIVDLEEELRQIGENLKALEVAEEKAQQREEEFKRQLKVIFDRLKTAESR